MPPVALRVTDPATGQVWIAGVGVPSPLPRAWRGDGLPGADLVQFGNRQRSRDHGRASSPADTGRTSAWTAFATSSGSARWGREGNSLAKSPSAPRLL